MYAHVCQGCVCFYMRVSACVLVYVCMRFFLFAYVRVFMHVKVFVYTYMYVCIYIHVCLYIHTCMCVYDCFFLLVISLIETQGEILSIQWKAMYKTMIKPMSLSTGLRSDPIYFFFCYY